MTIGERMKARRKEIGFSAEKVAELLGVSPATIYRYEKGDIEKVPGDKLLPIAEALSTTPAYLMGWIDAAERPVESGPESRSLSPSDSISDGERKLLSRFRLLTHDNQVRILERIESLLEDQFSTEEMRSSAG